MTTITPATKTETKIETKEVPLHHGHKNPPVGPTTSKPLPEWRKSRDYENFNPTQEK
jgi:hypothetical protein